MIRIKPKRRFRPPLNKTFVCTVNGYNVYTVDALAVRNSAQPDEEFDNVAIHDDFPDLIPEGEIWTAATTYRVEGRFFIANAVAELDAKRSGKSESQAFDAGVRAERKLREKETRIKFRNGRPHRRVPSAIYQRKYCDLPDKQFPIAVWQVNAKVVRCYYKTDYTEGGHGYVYRWVPKQQIWIESAVDLAEVPYIIAHEYIELRLMRDEGLEYDRAHEICAEMEFDLRLAKKRAIFPGLTRKSLGKADLAKLTSPMFFDFVHRNYVHGIIRRVSAAVSDLASKVLA